MTDGPWQLVVAAPARRAIAERLPEDIAGAVVEFVTGPLLLNPRRVGKALHYDLEGLYSARRGDYRVIYRIDEGSRTVEVRTVDHRRDVYRRR